MEEVSYQYSPAKNLKLLEERGIGFEDVIAILDARGPLAVIDHPNKAKYPRQKIYIVDVDGYAYLVPFEKHSATISLKTIYPSSKMTKRFKDQLIKGEKI